MRFVLLSGALLFCSSLGMTFEPEKKEAPAVRLPSYYAQLGLTDAQRTRIRELQLEFQPEIEKLEAELTKLKKRQTEEFEKILSPKQTKKLTDLREQAKAKRKKKALEKASKDTSAN